MHQSTSIDFLIRLKNAYAAGHSSLSLPASKFIQNLSQLLKKHGFIKDYSLKGKPKKIINISLVYPQNQPAITSVKLFSKPGRRWYEKKSSLPWRSKNQALIIVSTSQGLMSARLAAKKGLGGEIIAQIY